MLMRLPPSILHNICKFLSDDSDGPITDVRSELLPLARTCRTVAHAASDVLWSRVTIFLGEDIDRQNITRLLSICANPKHPLFRTTRRIEVYYRTSITSTDAPSPHTVTCGVLLAHILESANSLARFCFVFIPRDIVRENVQNGGLYWEVHEGLHQILVRLLKSHPKGCRVAQSLVLNQMGIERLLEESETTNVKALSLNYIRFAEIRDLGRYTKLRRLHLSNIDSPSLESSSSSSSRTFSLPRGLWTTLKTLVLTGAYHAVDADAISTSLLESIQESGGTKLDCLGFFIPAYAPIQKRIGHAFAASGSTIKRLGLMAKGLVKPDSIRDLSTAFPHTRDAALLGTLPAHVRFEGQDGFLDHSENYGLALSHFKDLVKLYFNLAAPNLRQISSMGFAVAKTNARMNFARGVATTCQTLQEVNFTYNVMPLMDPRRIYVTRPKSGLELFFAEEWPTIWWEQL